MAFPTGFGSSGPDIGFSIGLSTNQLKQQANEGLRNIHNFTSGGVASFKALQIQSQNSLQAITGSLFGFRNLLIFGGILVGLNNIIKSTADFQKKLTEISIITNNTALTFGFLRNTIMQVSKDTGQSLSEVTKSMRDIASAQVPVIQGMDILKVSAKLSVGSLTDMSTATSALITMMQGMPGQFKDATDASDLLFSIQDRGRIEMRGLAENMGRIIPIAKGAGVSATELGVAISAVSRGIPEADQALTGLRGLILALEKPGKENLQIAKQYGIELGRTATSGGNFFKTLEKIKELAPLVQIKLVENVRALNTLSAINTQISEDDFSAVMNRSGKTTEAFTAQSFTLSNQIDRLRATINLFGKELGNTLIPVIEIVIIRMKDFVESISPAKFNFLVLALTNLIVNFISATFRIITALSKLALEFLNVGNTGNSLDTFFKTFTRTIDFIEKSINKLTEAIKFLKENLGGLVPLFAILGGIVGSRFLVGGITTATKAFPKGPLLGKLPGLEGERGVIGTKIGFEQVATSATIGAVLGSRFSLAGIGAGLGSLVPGVGTIIGTGVGVTLGLLIQQLGGLSKVFEGLNNIVSKLITSFSNFIGRLTELLGITSPKPQKVSTPLENEIEAKRFEVNALESQFQFRQSFIGRNVGSFLGGLSLEETQTRLTKARQELDKLLITQKGITEETKKTTKAQEESLRFSELNFSVQQQILADLKETIAVGANPKITKEAIIALEAVAKDTKFFSEGAIQNLSALRQQSGLKKIQAEANVLRQEFNLLSDTQIAWIESTIDGIKKLGGTIDEELIQRLKITKGELQAMFILSERASRLKEIRTGQPALPISVREKPFTTSFSPEGFLRKDFTTTAENLNVKLNEQRDALANLKTKLDEIIPGYTGFIGSLANIQDLIDAVNSGVAGNVGLNINLNLLKTRFLAIVTELGKVSGGFDNLSEDAKKSIRKVMAELGIAEGQVKFLMSKAFSNVSAFFEHLQRTTQQGLSNVLFNLMKGTQGNWKDFLKGLWDSVVLKPLSELLAKELTTTLFSTQISAKGQLTGIIPRLLFGGGMGGGQTTQGTQPAKPSFIEKIAGFFGLGRKGTETVDPLKNSMETLAEKVSSSSSVVNSLTDNFKNLMQVKDRVISNFNALGGTINNTANNLNGLASSAINASKNLSSSGGGGSSILETIGNAMLSVPFPTKGAVPSGENATPLSLETISGNPSINIPKLAEGGIVTNPVIATVGEAGPEAIIPLKNSSNKETNRRNELANFNINISAIDGASVAKFFSDRDTRDMFTNLIKQAMKDNDRRFR